MRFSNILFTLLRQEALWLATGRRGVLGFAGFRPGFARGSAETSKVVPRLPPSPKGLWRTGAAGCFTACLMVPAILLAGICSAQEVTPEVEMRLANGVPVEGTFKSADPEGLTVQSAKGTTILPWKYLSAGTRWRYERPMLAELEAKKLKAGKEVNAKTEKKAPSKTEKKTPSKAGKKAPSKAGTDAGAN